jgi:hypothetical protein
LLADASIERRLRTIEADLERDLFGAEGCVDVLNLTRAKLVRTLHEEQLRAGSDLIRTNTGRASPLELRRFGLEEDAFAINYAAAQLAAAAVDTVPGEGRRRFVLGIVRDLGWDATALEIEEATAYQVSALLAGGTDGIAVEFAGLGCRGPAFLRGAARARDAVKSTASIFLMRQADEANDRLRSLADGLVRHREVAAGEVSANLELLRGADLISGRSAEDTAALDRLLQELTEEGCRPSVDRAQPPGIHAPLRPPAPRPLPAEGGTVLYRASLWSGRRARR